MHLKLAAAIWPTWRHSAVFWAPKWKFPGNKQLQRRHIRCRNSKTSCLRKHPKEWPQRLIGRRKDRWRIEPEFSGEQADQPCQEFTGHQCFGRNAACVSILGLKLRNVRTKFCQRRLIRLQRCPKIHGIPRLLRPPDWYSKICDFSSVYHKRQLRRNWIEWAIRWRKWRIRGKFWAETSRFVWQRLDLGKWRRRKSRRVVNFRKRQSDWKTGITFHVESDQRLDKTKLKGPGVLEFSWQCLDFQNCGRWPGFPRRDHEFRKLVFL